MACAISRKILCPSAVLLLTGGCVSSGLSPLNYGVRHVQGGELSAVFDAALAALISTGYGIAHADAATGVIITQPIPTVLHDERIRAGARLSTRGGLRRVARIHVMQGPPDESGGATAVAVYCKVVVQEQTTEAHRMFRQEHRASDIPADTPIDREAATTIRQNTVWRTIRRDKAAERRILQAILEQTDT